jgi:glycine/D-amino acid oxidase-like deaminating enzyme
MEARSGKHFWHPIELVKLFPGEREAGQWQRAMGESTTAPFIDQRPQPGVDRAVVHALHGHGTVHRTAWLDVPAMLEAQRSGLLQVGALSEVDIADVGIVREPDGVRIGDRSAPVLIHCTGPFAQMNGLVPVKGEGLTLRLSGLPRDRMLHRGVFALPVGDDLHRVGATFAWDDLWEGPTEAARQWLLAQLEKMTPLVPEVTDQWCGVRPTSRDRRPILGKVSAHEAVFNGLGSRGVLLAPWCAAHLADHLFAGQALDPEVDVARFSPLT